MFTKSHALLSASSSSRWLKCPASVKAIESRKKQSISSDKGSFYAQEGNAAHTLAELCFRNLVPACTYEGNDLNGVLVTDEMVTHVQNYVNYVNEHRVDNTFFQYETKVDYSHIAPNSFGTCDAFVVDNNDRVCHVFDLKYGKGEEVSAHNNTQLMLYASGVCELINFEMNEIVLHIFQPRLDNISTFRINREQLTYFESYARDKAANALSDNPTFNPGESQCKWCSFKSYCAALGDVVKPFYELTEGSRLQLYKDKKLIEMFLKDVEESIYRSACEGTKYEGFKLVNGRKSRKWNDKAASVLESKLGDEAYEKKLIGITKAKEYLSNDELDELTYTVLGKVQHVPESDNRPEINEDYKAWFDL